MPGRVAYKKKLPRARQSAGGTKLSELLLAAVTVRRRSTIFVVSDFISEPCGAVGLLATRHEVVAVRLTDPLELALPDLGLLTLRDAETGEQLLVDTHSPAFRRRFAAIAAQREAELRESLARAGVDTLELSTDDDLASAILRFTDLRRQRARVAAGGGMPADLRKTIRSRDNGAAMNFTWPAAFKWPAGRCRSRIFCGRSSCGCCCCCRCWCCCTGG